MDVGVNGAAGADPALTLQTLLSYLFVWESAVFGVLELTRAASRADCISSTRNLGPHSVSLQVRFLQTTLLEPLLTGLAPADIVSLPALWFEACLEALHRSDFMSTPTFEAVQVICILPMVSLFSLSSPAHTHTP